MNCPYCNAYLSTYAARCPECRSILPAERLMPGKNQIRKTFSQQQRDAMVGELTMESEVPLIHCLLADAQIDRAVSSSKNFDSISDLFEELHHTLTDAGITLSKVDLRLLLSAMAGSRILRFPQMDAESVRPILAVINGFMSGITIEEGRIPAVLSNASRLFGDTTAYADPERTGEGYYRDSVFLQNAYIAAATQAPLIQVVSDMHENSYVATELFSSYALMPESAKIIARIQTSDIELLPRFWFLFEEGFYLPRNMWFAFTGDGMVSSERKKNAPEIYPELTVFPAISSGADAPLPTGARLTYEDFCRLCRLSRETVYFPESVYRQLDALEAYMKEAYPAFRFDNCLLRRLEVFSSVSLSCGAGETEALDTMLWLYLIPYIQKQATDTVGFVRALTQIFPDRDLSHCRKALSAED